MKLFSILLITGLGISVCGFMQAQERLYPQEFPLEKVKLLDGPFKKAMDLNVKVLLEYDVDRLLQPYQKQAGIVETGAAFPNWAGLDGHVGGHYLSALAIHYATAKAHAVFVTSASGNTRDTVMVCSYNRCRKNVKLSSVCSVGGSTKAVEIMIPRSFKGGKPSLFVCGSVLNVINSQGTSRSLAGYSNVTASLSMTLLKPDGSTAKTWPATTGTSISGTYNNWNASGEWILKVTATTSTGATKTWYGTIRVVLK